MAGRKKGTTKTGGRKKGTPNKLSRATVLKARKTGELPHEFLLRVMRGADKFKAVELLPNGKTKSVTRFPTLSERFDAARADSCVNAIDDARKHGLRSTEWQELKRALRSQARALARIF